MTHPAHQHPSFVVTRVGRDHERHELTAAQLQRDDIATSAVDLSTRFLHWADEHGWEPPQSSFEIYITSQPDMVDNASSGIALGAPRMLHRHTARSPEVVGHEFGHRVATSVYKGRTHASEGRVLSDGIADLVGVAFARSLGHRPALADWKLGDELARRGANVKLPFIRDLAAPAFPRVDDLVEYQRARGFGEIPSHQAGGPLGRAYVQITEHLGNARAERLLMDALLRELPTQLGATREQTVDEFVEDLTRPLTEPVIRSAFARIATAFQLAASSDDERQVVTDAMRGSGLLAQPRATPRTQSSGEAATSEQRPTPPSRMRPGISPATA